MDPRPWLCNYDFEVPTTIRYPRMTVSGFLNIPVGVVPDKAALNFRGNEISFFELRRLVWRFANALGALGIEKGDRVGLQLPTSPQYVITYYALLHLGAIVVNINTMNTVSELKYVVEHTGLRTLFSTHDNVDRMERLSQQVYLELIILTRMSDFANEPIVEKETLPEGWYDLSQLLEACNNTRPPRVEISPSDPAQIQFTGGTTGFPKGATLTHQNVVSATVQCYLWGKTVFVPIEQRNILCALPYYHVYGNVVAMGMGLLSGATQILVDRFDLDKIMDLLAGFHRIGYYPAVPTMISAIINHARADELRLDHRLGLLGSGGAPMPVELIERVQDMGINYGEGWGMSETTSLGMANPFLGMKKPGSIGIPFPDTDVRLVDPEDGKTEVAVGEPGEILIRSPLVMQGYWQDPEKTAEQIKDGWLSTGDIATRDEDSYFYIVDRKKDMIIASGYNVYPREIDEVLYQHPKILEAVAVGIPHEYRGETVKAFVVVKEGATLTEEELIKFCREHLAAYKAPKSVEFRESLPKTGVGKILRRTLRDEELAKQPKS